MTVTEARGLPGPVSALSRLRVALAEPVDPAAFVLFRVGFGLLASASALRFVAKGWVQSLLLAPSFHFAWLPGLVVPPPVVLYGLFGVQALAGLALALGWAPRLALMLWLVAFGWVELLDKALYLNHYVLFTLLGVWLLASPVHRVTLQSGALPTWAWWLLRVQVASVYLWAGLAKLNGDWLLRGEPLRTWLGARVDLPAIGPWLGTELAALGMSWAGLLYDLSVPLLLLWPRTRALGWVLVVGFHAAVGALFPIGVFPWLMVLSATLLLAPGWPRRWIGGRLQAAGPRRPLGQAATLTWGVVVAALVVFPGRARLCGEDVGWTERGARFAWRVMLNEKTGLVEYRVVEGGTGRTWVVQPREELTPVQLQQLQFQPDLIRDYALHLAQRFAGGGVRVAVFAEAWVSLNGRPAQRLLRPDLDLTRPLAELDAAGWILPRAPDGAAWAQPRRPTVAP